MRSQGLYLFQRFEAPLDDRQVRPRFRKAVLTMCQRKATSCLDASGLELHLRLLFHVKRALLGIVADRQQSSVALQFTVTQPSVPYVETGRPTRPGG